MNPLILLVALIGAIAGIVFAVGRFASDRGDKSAAWQSNAIVSLLVVGIIAIACAYPLPAKAATVAEILNVAKFTDERGECPRLHRVAIAPDGTRGCWTMGEVDRRITIRWPDGRVVEYSEIQFNIYAR